MLYKYMLLLIGGAFAGFVNVLAGGGSMVTIPLLNFAGLPIDMANGTNRVAILLQNIVSVSKFFKEKKLPWKRALLLALFATLGAILGTTIAITIDRTLLKRIIGVIFLIMLFITLKKPDLGTVQRKTEYPLYVSAILFFLIGIYGGFIQAGVGFFLVYALVLVEGYDLVSANAVKVSIVLLYTIISLSMFAFKGMVDWKLGLILAIGNMTGAYVGTVFAIFKGSQWVKWVLIIMVSIVSIAYILGV